MNIFQSVIRHSSFVILLLLSLFSWGCHKKSTVPIAAPARSNSPPPAVIPPEIMSPPPAETITMPSSLDLGEINFKLGNYSQAARMFERFLQENPHSSSRDTALFRLGLSRFLAGGSGRDLRQAEAALRRLLSEFTNSPYRDQAEFILGLHAQIEKLRSDIKERDEKIKRLSEELQKLKEIDMQRRPSRPP